MLGRIQENHFSPDGDTDVGAKKDGNDIPEFEHLDAYYHQIGHDSWKTTTPDYKTNTFNYMQNYIDTIEYPKLKESAQNRLNETRNLFER